MNNFGLSMFNLPNLLTAGNMLCGVLSILLSLSGRIDLAPYPIFLGAIFDFLDGFVARLLKQQGELGKQLDSLADMVTFGLAPGVMMMMILINLTGCPGIEPSCDPRYFIRMFSDKDYNFPINFNIWIDEFLTNSRFEFIPFISLIIPLFSMFRLAKFNIDTRQSDSFIGVPTPANTIFFCMFPLILTQDFAEGSISFAVREFIMQVWILIPVIVIMSLLLVSEIPLFSLKFKHYKWKGNEIRFIFLITCLIIIPLTRFWSLGIIVLLYLILSLIQNLFKAKQHEIQS